MFQNLSKCLLALLLGSLFAGSTLSARSNGLPLVNFSNSCSAISNFIVADGTPIVEVLVGASPRTSIMSWSGFENNRYTVEVTDLTSFCVIASFSTSNTSATVGGLTTGHLYRYSVTDGVDFIIEDVVH